jgi:hypothetical protein
LSVTNTAPRFTSSIPDVSVAVGSTDSINLSTYYTDDQGHSVILSLTQALSGGGAATDIPSLFFSLSGTTLSMSPQSGEAGNTYSVVVSISDGELASTDSFLVTVVKQSNSAPTFSSAPPPISMSYSAATPVVSTISNYFSDPNGDVLTMIAT